MKKEDIKKLDKLQNDIERLEIVQNNLEKGTDHLVVNYGGYNLIGENTMQLVPGLARELHDLLTSMVQDRLELLIEQRDSYVICTKEDNIETNYIPIEKETTF